jgi:transcriptional repressor NrdR
MKCIYCDFKKTDVINSRKTKNATVVWRRRKCLKCYEIFTTSEHAYDNNVFVIKRNKYKTRMIYEKLFVSIFMSFQHTKYFDGGNTALKCKKISDLVTKKILSLRKKVIHSRDIIFIVYKELLKVDKFAAEKYKNYSEYRLKNLTRAGY